MRLTAALLSVLAISAFGATPCAKFKGFYSGSCTNPNLTYSAYLQVWQMPGDRETLGEEAGEGCSALQFTKFTGATPQTVSVLQHDFYMTIEKREENTARTAVGYPNPMSTEKRITHSYWENGNQTFVADTQSTYTNGPMKGNWSMVTKYFFKKDRTLRVETRMVGQGWDEDCDYKITP
ncbi:hypothetical protein K2X33_04050 [bacterium]|nr:hypothetical protein [bacterium]